MPTVVVLIHRYVFQSGNSEHPGDKFTNTTLEIFTVNNVTKESNKSVKNSNNSRNISNDEFLKIDRFNDLTGRLEGKVNESVGAVQAMRLTTKSAGLAWVLISEVIDTSLIKINFLLFITT